MIWIKELFRKASTVCQQKQIREGEGGAMPYQLVYISSAVGQVDGEAVLAVSRRNNARDGLTGLLYADGRRFLQVLEGERAAVEWAYQRIAIDPRHRALVVLSQRDVAEREFGPWEMAERAPGADGEALLERIDHLLTRAAPSVRATFEGLARIHRAA